MNNPSISVSGPVTATGATVEASASAIAWPAILGGTVVSLAVSVVLMEIGSGFGLAWVSSASARTLTVVAVIWLIVAQWIAGGVGGYLTGRLRTKWVGTHTHEVFFRDTAHGFLTWSAATIVGLLLLAVASSALVAGGVRAASTLGAGVAQAASGAAASAAGDMRGYEMDKLFRSPQPATGQSGTSNAVAGDTRAEVGRIFAQGAANGGVSADDRAYLVQLVVAHTGMAQPDAQKRVDDTIAEAKAAQAKAVEVADAARKAASKFSIFTGLSMLVGAFIACAAAALGGQQRDEHP